MSPTVGRWVAAGAVTATVLGGAYLCADLSVPDPPKPSVRTPSAAELAPTVSMLAAAREKQGVCYGWTLVHSQGGDRVLSSGSHAGDGVPVGSAPGCERHLELWVRVDTRARESRRVSVHILDEKTTPGVLGYETAPGAVGTSTHLFLADTGLGIVRAARALPLIAAERGLAEPVDVPPAPAAAAAPELPDVGNDFFRSRLYGLLIGGLLLALVVLMVALDPKSRPWRRDSWSR